MLHCKKRVLRVNNHNIRTCHSAEIGITAKLKQTQAEMNSAPLWRSEKHRKWKERDKIQRSEFIWIHLRCFNRSAFNATVPQSSVGGARVIRRATARTRGNTCIVQRTEQEQGREQKNLNTDCLPRDVIKSTWALIMLILITVLPQWNIWFANEAQTFLGARLPTLSY